MVDTLELADHSSEFEDIFDHSYWVKPFNLSDNT
jgi:hypothetical protein